MRNATLAIALFGCLMGLVTACYHVPVTGRSAFILTSPQEEDQLGDQAYQQVLAQSTVSTNADWKALVTRVGQRIAKVADEPSFKWEFTLIESQEKNAFCLPGGKIAVYTGILPAAQTEAGLAVILGHEVAHATARHQGQRITLMFGEQLGLAGLSMILNGKVNPQEQQLLMGALGLGAQVGLTLPFTRSQEAEADKIGLHYTAMAGYDPAEGPKLWRRMASLEQGSHVPKLLSDHPPSEAREKALEAELPTVQPLYAQSPKYGQGETIVAR